MTFWSRKSIWPSLFFGAASAVSSGCHRGAPYADRDLESDPQLPEFEEGQEVLPYEGDDAYVLEAQRSLPTGIDLHRNVIWRTCTPNDGVCHNRKEYPELRTPAAFIAAFDAPCNIQAGETSSIFDGCEPTGDRVFLDSWARESDRDFELGFIRHVPGELEDDDKSFLPGSTSPGIHVFIDGRVELSEGAAWGKLTFSRKDANGIISLGELETQWWTYDNGTKLFGRVRDYHQGRVEQILSSGILQGDANQNGVFGAQSESRVPLLNPGAPESSYLIARMRGEMHGQRIPGSRMPLANKPLTVPEMLAFFCFVEGFSDRDRNSGLMSEIDYRNCSFSEDPGSLNLLGDGVTWNGRISKILEFNCGGCHGEDAPISDLSLVGEGAYAALLRPSQQVPELALIEPGDAASSYLYLKLTHDPSIVGQGMPINGSGESTKLSEAELGDILTWIQNGAVEDE